MQKKTEDFNILHVLSLFLGENKIQYPRRPLALDSDNYTVIGIACSLSDDAHGQTPFDKLDHIPIKLEAPTAYVNEERLFNL
jgi:hypothetical protein